MTNPVAISDIINIDNPSDIDNRYCDDPINVISQMKVTIFREEIDLIMKMMTLLTNETMYCR